MKGKPAPKISTEQLCRDYYDSQMFTGVFEGTVYVEILKLGPSAKAINTDILLCELTALNIELFGLAWFDHNYRLSLSKKQEKDQADSATCTEIAFTKSYLEQAGRDDIWSAAGFYNDTIFQARTAQEISRDWSVLRDRGYYERGVYFSDEADKRLIALIRNHYDKLLADKECALRLANRLLSVEAWQEGIMLPQKLSLAFAQRLNYSPNVEALLLLQRVTVGLYKNANTYIGTFIDYGSLELARKGYDKFMKHAIRVVQEDMQRKEKNEN